MCVVGGVLGWWWLCDCDVCVVYGVRWVFSVVSVGGLVIGVVDVWLVLGNVLLDVLFMFFLC